jgi:hypothetical protein
MTLLQEQGNAMRLTMRNSLRHLKEILIVVFLSCSVAGASDWSEPAQQLARKIVAVTGPCAIAVTTENRSSLAKKDFDAMSGTLRVDLEALGARAAKPEQAAAAAAVWLSENRQFYVWLAEIQQGAGESAVVMVTAPRGDGAGLARESMPMSLHKIPLWTQEDRILDVAVLEEDTAAKTIAVLDGKKVSIYRLKSGKWQQAESLDIAHAGPWPRDLRGRVTAPAARDHLLEVYLPGVFCRSTATLPLTLSCRESDDPWPLMATAGTSFPTPVGAASAQPLGAFYSTTRNFFGGALAPGIGKITNVGKFYSAASLPRDQYFLWLFAGTDGQIHFVDGVADQAMKADWGSDIVSVKTPCGSGWQVLATGTAENGRDTIRAYEIADRDPVPVSAALDFSGEITALWAEAKGDNAIAVVRDQETGDYEALRVAVACSQ